MLVVSIKNHVVNERSNKEIIMVVVYGIINYTTISGNDCVNTSRLIVIMTCAIVASNSKLLGSKKGKGSSGANQLELMLVIAEQLQVLLLIAILVP